MPVVGHLLLSFSKLYIWRCSALNIFKISSEVLFIKICFLLFLTCQISHSVDHVCILNGNMSYIPKVNMLSCLEVLGEMSMLGSGLEPTAESPSN